MLNSPVMTRQRLGQHFLKSLGWRKRILETLPLDSGADWLEIGPGHGEMTELLAPRATRIIAVEADHLLLPGLRERARSEWPNAEIIGGDVLAVDIGSLARSRPLRVYGNLPYYITTPILQHLFAYSRQIASIHIVIQWEVASRIAAKPGGRDYGSLSILCQFYARPQIMLRIPPGAFSPPPRVTSALLQLKLPGEDSILKLKNEPAFLQFTQSCFGKKRKTLRNNLKELGSADPIARALARVGLPLDVRAEQVSIAQFADLFREFGKDL